VANLNRKISVNTIKLGVLSVEFEMIEPVPFVNRNRYDPTQGEELDDEVADHGEVVVEFVD
jgi:hypothetical protein